MRRVATVIVSLVLLGSAAACGSRSGSAAVDAGPAPETPTAAFLAGAASRTSGYTTGRMTMTIAFSDVPGMSDAAAMTATGSFDTAARAADVEFDLSSLMAGVSGMAPAGFDEPIREVVDDGHVYVQWAPFSRIAGASTPWVELVGFSDLLGDLTGSGAAGVDPSGEHMLGGDSLDYLDQVGDVTTVGHEEIDGADTTHYRAVVDLRTLLDEQGGQLSERLRSQVEEQLGASGATIPVDVWIDADGLVRRMRLEMSGGAFGGMGGSGSVVVTTELRDLGQPVAIQVPGPEEVSPLDLGATLRSLGRAGGSGFGSSGSGRGEVWGQAGD